MSRVDPLDTLKSFEPKAPTEQKTKQSTAEVEAMANQHGFVARNPTPAVVPVDRSKRRFKLTSRESRKRRMNCTVLPTRSISLWVKRSSVRLQHCAVN
jgi:hypothetical protein